LVLGFQENFGGTKTVIKFIGIKGEFVRTKPKPVAMVYEVRAKAD
jgi:hypothetical protein